MHILQEGEVSEEKKEESKKRKQNSRDGGKKMKMEKKKRGGSQESRNTDYSAAPREKMRSEETGLPRQTSKTIVRCSGYGPAEKRRKIEGSSSSKNYRSPACEHCGKTNHLSACCTVAYGSLFFSSTSFGFKNHNTGRR